MPALRHFAVAPVIVVLMGGSAHAALTADQIWQSWKDGGALVGLTISAATEANSGGVLSLNGVKVTSGSENAPFTISDLTLTENSDGTVEIRPGADMGMTIGTAEAGGTVKVLHDGLSLVAREGENGGIIYDYEADQLDVAYDFTMPGFSFDETETPAPGKDSGKISFEGLAGAYSDTPGENRKLGLNLTAEKLLYDMASDQPGIEMKTSQQSAGDAFEIEGEFVLPSVIKLGDVKSTADFGTALQQGLALTMRTTQGPSAGTASHEDMFFPYDMTMEVGPSTADLTFNKDVFSLNSRGDDGMSFVITSAMTPEPVLITLDTVVMNMLVPVMSAETAADYGMVFNLGQLSISDAVWDMFDPEAALEREAIDLSVDISGKTKVDWVAMIAASENGGPELMPEPESLNVNSAILKLAGAALNATAALTFDNSMGMPMPLGEANVDLTGAEKLISGLVSVGILTEEDAMMAQMMIGSFMVPGTAEDSLTSKIEFKEGFQIFANGQQIQ